MANLLKHCGGARTLKGRRHIRYEEPAGLANLHLVRLDSPGENDGMIKELRDPLSV